MDSVFSLLLLPGVEIVLVVLDSVVEVLSAMVRLFDVPLAWISASSLFGRLLPVGSTGVVTIAVGIPGAMSALAVLLKAV